MSDLPTFDETEEEIGDEEANELVVNAERFLTLIQTGGSEGLDAVTDEDGPRLVSGGFAQIYLEATGGNRDGATAGEFVSELIPTKSQIAEFELTDEEINGIAQIRDMIATTITEDHGLPDADEVREQVNRTVDNLLTEAGQIAANPLNGAQRERLLKTTYQEQIYYLGVLAALAENLNSED